MSDKAMEDGTVGSSAFGVHGAALADVANPPEWVELIPAGEFSGRDGRGPFKLSEPEAVIAETQALRMQAGIPIDYDHATDFAAPQGRPAPAAGWIKQMEVRDGAVWGRVEWTRHGAAAVTTREYRYISPVFEHAKGGEVVRLLRAALTNNPNLYLTAIAARIEYLTNRGARRSGAAAGRGRQGDDEMETYLPQLRELLGLDGKASGEQIVDIVREMAAAQDTPHDDKGRGNDEDAGGMSPANGADADPGHYVPIMQFERTLTELNTLKATRARERAEHAVNEAMRAGKVTPAQREWAIAYCQSDHRGFANFVARQPPLVPSDGGFSGEPHGAANRTGYDDSSMVSRDASAVLNQTEIAVCSRLGIRPGDYLRRKSERDSARLNP